MVAEGAALSGSWRSRFRSRPCMGTSGMNPSCHGRPCGHRCHTDRNPCIPRRRLPASTGPSATACRQTAGHQGRNGRTRRHPVGSSLLRRPTAAHGAARAARGPEGAVAAAGGTASPASAAAWGQAAGASRRRRRRACGPPGIDSPFDPAAAEASTSPLSSSSQRRLYEASAAAANRMRAAKPTLRRL